MIAAVLWTGEADWNAAGVPDDDAPMNDGPLKKAK